MFSRSLVCPSISPSFLQFCVDCFADNLFTFSFLFKPYFLLHFPSIVFELTPHSPSQSGYYPYCFSFFYTLLLPSPHLSSVGGWVPTLIFPCMFLPPLFCSLRPFTHFFSSPLACPLHFYYLISPPLIQEPWPFFHVYLFVLFFP